MFNVPPCTNLLKHMTISPLRGEENAWLSLSVSASFSLSMPIMIYINLKGTHIGQAQNPENSCEDSYEDLKKNVALLIHDSPFLSFYLPIFDISDLSFSLSLYPTIFFALSIYIILREGKHYSNITFIETNQPLTSKWRNSILAIIKLFWHLRLYLVYESIY